MRIEISDALAGDRPILSRFVELYLYDFSEFTGWDVGEDGRFGDQVLAGCWIEPWRHPFLVRVDAQLAGFAIVDDRSHLTGDRQTHDMKEFFILRKYRGRGVGTFVATRLFDLFPGKWEVRELAKNAAALAFWRTVIARYMGGRFTEVASHERQRGPVQFFDTTDRRA